MKKLLSTVFAMVMVVGLSACGGQPQEAAPNNTPSEPKANESAPKTNNTGSTAKTEEGQKINIKVSYENPENTPKHKGAVRLKESIEKASNGRITVDLYPNGTLFDDDDELQNLLANNVQITIPGLSELTGIDPMFNLHTLPFLYSNEEAAMSFWDGETGQEILSGLEKHGLRGLSIWPNGELMITNNKRPILSPEDMNGLIFRIIGGKLTEETYKKLGAGTEHLPFGELYTALEQGVLDGQENAISNIDAKKLDEVQKYMTVSGYSRLDYVVLTNTQFWSSLDDASKKIIEEGIQEGTKEARQKAKELNDEAFAAIKERGEIEIVELTPEQRQAFRDVLKPLYDEWGPQIGEEYIQKALNSGK